jgi:AraC-like DNA-binding protein
MLSCYHIDCAMSSKEIFPKIYLYKRIVNAKLFVDAHFAEKLDLNNISDEAYFSKYHFIRLFKSVYKMTPHQYLVNVRISNACRLLKTELTISECCFAVGFESVSSFSGLFKRTTGESPAAYKEIHRRRVRSINTAPLQYIPGCFAEKLGFN